MNRKTLQALKDSIEKWRQIERGEMADMASDNCPLCIHFSNAYGDIDCSSCPVMKRTGKYGCVGTPYVNWSLEVLVNVPVADTPKLVRLARAEREFLENLLPKGKP